MRTLGPIPTSVDEVRRWRQRPWLGVLIRLAAFVVPFCAASLAVAVVGAAYGPPAGAFGSGPSMVRLGVLLSVGVVAALLAERLVRPLFPLASLLQMSLLFPDRAPSRLLTALRAGATRNAQDLLDDPRAAADQREAASRILVLVSALGRHDRITRGHCERVRSYADLMATQLGLSSHDADRLRWAALLHDVGKLRVAYATLNKKGKLDPEEWKAIKRHPTDGALLIAPMADWLGSWATAVPQHHERVDGNGYPAGLAGEQIHLGARIIAVVDAFDVMTASRSYKRPISSAAARRELQRCAGSQFDPVLVEAFLQVPSRRAGWWAGVAAAILQVPGATYLARIPGSVASTVSRIPAAAASAASTVAIGATSLVLVAGVSTAVRPAAVPAGTTASPTGGATAPAAPGGPSDETGATPPSTGAAVTGGSGAVTVAGEPTVTSTAPTADPGSGGGAAGDRTTATTDTTATTTTTTVGSDQGGGRGDDSGNGGSEGSSGEGGGADGRSGADDGQGGGNDGATPGG